MVSKEWDDEFSPEVDRPDNFEDWRSIVDEDLKQSIDVSLSDAMLVLDHMDLLGMYQDGMSTEDATNEILDDLEEAS